MKAVVYTRYGSPDVLRFTDVEKPTPKDSEVLVKVQAVSLNRSDWEALRGKPLYARIMGPGGRWDGAGRSAGTRCCAPAACQGRWWPPPAAAADPAQRRQTSRQRSELHRLLPRATHYDNE
jgi:hypothetical protein